MSLTQRLVLFAILAMLPVAAVVLVLESELRSAREIEITDEVERQTQRAASEMARLVEGVRTMLVTIGAAGLETRSAADCSAYLARVAAGLPKIYALGVMDGDGNLSCRSRAFAPGLNYADRDYFRLALSTGDFAIGTLIESKIDHTRVLPFALPVRGPDGRVSAVISAALDLGFLNRLVGGWSIAEGSSLTIADRDGVIVARTPEPDRFVGTRIPDTYLPWVTSDAPGVSEVMSQDGTRRVLAYIPATLPPVRGLYVSTGIASDKAFSVVASARLRSLLIIGVGILAGVVSAFAAGRSFVRRPVTELVALADSWRAGTRAARGRRPSGREFQEIAAALDQMGEDLQQREARLRTVIRHAPYPLMVVADDGAIVEASESWWRLSEHRPMACAHAWAAAAFGEGAAASADPVADPFLIGEHDRLAAAEREFTGGSGRRHAWEFGVVPMEPLPDGRRLRLVAAADVTDRKAAARRQELLVAELNHRVKNTLAVVQAMGDQTARTAADMEEFRVKFSERLQALARTHDLLTRSAWRDVEVRELLEAELGHVAPRDRLVLSGPDVKVPATFAVSLCLVIHELATNAVKYGAFAGPDGRLSITWTARRGTEATELAVDWKERAGRPVAAPLRRGFGSRLIARTLAAIGSGDTVYDPDGLHFTMRVRLPDPAAETAA